MKRSGPSGTRLLGIGLGLVLRQQRFVWALWAIGLALAWASGASLYARIEAVTGTSLLSDRLVHGMDIAVLAELLRQPELQLGAQNLSALIAGLLFLLVYVFALGGILSDYLAPSSPSRRDFFSSCGANFWPLLRLTASFAAVAGLGFAALNAVRGAIDDALEPHSASEGTIPAMVTLAILLLIMAGLRLWFDIAELHLVSTTGKRSAWRSILAGARTTGRHLFRLYWMYLRISLAGLLAMAFVLILWVVYLPPADIAGAWVLARLISVCWLVSRLWQRGSECAWFAAEFPPPLPEPEVIAAPPVHEPLVAPAPEPVLPPAPEPPPEPLPPIAPEAIS